MSITAQERVIVIITRPPFPSVPADLVFVTCGEDCLVVDLSAFAALACARPFAREARIRKIHRRRVGN